VRTHLGTPKLYMIHCKNLIAASCVMLTTGIAFTNLVNVSIAINKNLNPPSALGRIPKMLIPQIAKGQERSICRRGFTCFVVCF
jgi:hypothetical protein